MTHRRHSSRALVPVASLIMVLAAAGPALAVELDEILANFDRVQGAIRTLSAEFIETTHSTLLTKPLPVEVVPVVRKLHELFIGDREPQLHLRPGQGNPQLTPDTMT